MRSHKMKRIPLKVYLSILWHLFPVGWPWHMCRLPLVTCHKMGLKIWGWAEPSSSVTLRSRGVEWEEGSNINHHTDYSPSPILLSYPKGRKWRKKVINLSHTNIIWPCRGNKSLERQLFTCPHQYDILVQWQTSHFLAACLVSICEDHKINVTAEQRFKTYQPTLIPYQTIIHRAICNPKLVIKSC